MIYLKKDNDTQTAYVPKNGSYEGRLSYKEGYEAGKAEGIEEGRNNPITTNEVYFSNGIKTNTHNVGVISFDVAIPTSPLKGSNYIETTFFPYWHNGCIFGLQSSSSYLAYIQNEKLYILLNNTNLVLERPCAYAKWHTLRIYTERAVFDGEEVFYGETFETDDLVMACINRGGRGYYRGEIAYIKHTEDEQNTLMWVVPNPDAEQRTLIRVRKDETGWSRADNYLGIRLQIATANLPISESVVFVEGDGVCPELTELNVSENGRYEGSFNVVNVDVPDVNGSYDEGYNNGYNDGLNAGGDCPELTELNVSENGTYEGAYNIVNVDVPTEGGSCNLQERWLQYNSTDELTDSIFVDVHPEEGYDGMSRVVANIQPIMDYKYDEGYNEGKNKILNKLQTITITQNGVYTPEPYPSTLFDGNDVFNFAWADTGNAIELRFRVNGEGWIFGNNKVGLFAEKKNIVTLYWFGYAGSYYIEEDDINTMVIKPFDTENKVIVNGIYYEIDGNIGSDTETTEIKLGGNIEEGYCGRFNLVYAKFWSGFNEYNNSDIPLFHIIPNENGNVKCSIGGGDYNEVNNEGGGHAIYEDINVFEGWNKVNVNVPTEGEGDLTPSAVEKKFDTLAFRTENIHDGDIIMDRTKLEDYFSESAEDYFIAYTQNKNSVVICEQGEFTNPSVSTIENGALDWNRIEYFHSFTIHTFGTDMTRDTGSNLLQLHLQGYGTIAEGATNIIFKTGCFATSNRLNKIVFYAPYNIVVEDYAFEGVSNSGEVIIVGTDNSDNRAKYDALMTQLGDGWSLTFTDSYNG